MTFKTSITIEPSHVVIIGKTYKDAVYWKGYFTREFPELADAREISAHEPRAIEGLRVQRVFVSPEAIGGRYYDMTLLVLDRSLRKTQDSDKEIVFLSSHLSDDAFLDLMKKVYG